MKYYFIFVFIICATASCNSPEKLICRTWKVKNIVFGSGEAGAPNPMLDQIREQLVHDYRFTLTRRDSTYIIVQEKENKVTPGKWWFSKDKKELFTKNEFALVNSKIIELTKGSFVFESKNTDSGLVKFICVPAGK